MLSSKQGEVGPHDPPARPRPRRARVESRSASRSRCVRWWAGRPTRL